MEVTRERMQETRTCIGMGSAWVHRSPRVISGLCDHVSSRVLSYKWKSSCSFQDKTICEPPMRVQAGCLYDSSFMCTRTKTSPHIVVSEKKKWFKRFNCAQCCKEQNCDRPRLSSQQKNKLSQDAAISLHTWFFRSGINMVNDRSPQLEWMMVKPKSFKLEELDDSLLVVDMNYKWRSIYINHYTSYIWT